MIKWCIGRTICFFKKSFNWEKHFYLKKPFFQSLWLEQFRKWLQYIVLSNNIFGLASKSFFCYSRQFTFWYLFWSLDISFQHTHQAFFMTLWKFGMNKWLIVYDLTIHQEIIFYEKTQRRNYYKLLFSEWTDLYIYVLRHTYCLGH